MHHIYTPVALPPAKAKSAALSAFDAACRDPAAADWQAVAYGLAAALQPRKRPTEDPGDGFAPWVDRPTPRYTSRMREWDRHRIRVEFADGEIIERGFSSDPGKPINIAAGMRGAIDYWRGRRAKRGAAGNYYRDHADRVRAESGLEFEVPPVVSVQAIGSGLVWCPAAVNRATAAYRAPDHQHGAEIAAGLAQRERDAAAHGAHFDRIHAIHRRHGLSGVPPKRQAMPRYPLPIGELGRRIMAQALASIAGVPVRAWRPAIAA